MPEAFAMPRIFISYSTKDLELVRTRLTPMLEGLGAVPWCSATDIPMAVDWERQIRSATLGRLDTAELRLPDGCVSRQHAKLGLGRSGAAPVLTLTDLGSANGTYVNQERLAASRQLAVGDLIELGKVRLRVREIDFGP